MWTPRSAMHTAIRLGHVIFTSTRFPVAEIKTETYFQTLIGIVRQMGHSHSWRQHEEDKARSVNRGWETGSKRCYTTKYEIRKQECCQLYHGIRLSYAVPRNEKGLEVCSHGNKSCVFWNMSFLCCMSGFDWQNILVPNVVEFFTSCRIRAHYTTLNVNKYC